MSTIASWTNYPHVNVTQQFSATDHEFFIQRMILTEQAMIGGQNPPRLSQPVPRVLTIYRNEGSTRTDATFTEAARRLGFHTKHFFGQFSSEMKGESVDELVMAITQTGGMGRMSLTDYLVMRHKQAHACTQAMEVIQDANDDHVQRRPTVIINAGDGDHQHPTQAWVDLLTIYQERKCPGHPLDDFTILFSGDTRYSRTINSLCHTLGRFSDHHRLRIVFSSHPDLKPKEGMLDYLRENAINYDFQEDFTAALREADVVYMTRIQKERFPSQELYPAVKGKFIFKQEYLELLRPNAFVMHPLPINRDPADPPAEIDPVLCRLARANHPQLVWCRQSHRGLPVRFALLDLIEASLQERYGV